jgi:hypothetical protein
MAIETPAPWDAPAQGDNYHTIGQLYKALWDGIQNCVTQFGEAAVFNPDPAAEQRTDIYLGKFGGHVVNVTDLASAEQAIQQIVAQGEGATSETHPLVPSQPYGAYEHYGMRSDATYGPILGTPYELSHYYKFLTVANAGNFPDTYPIISSPRLQDFSNPDAIDAANAFNISYSVMLRALEQSFLVADNSEDLYFKVVLPMMHTQLPALADYLMKTPAFTHGDKSVGPNAAPTYEYIADATFSSYLASLEKLQKLIGVNTADTPLTLKAANIAQAVPAQSSTALAGLHPAESSKEDGLSMALSTARGLKELADSMGLGL